MDSKKFEERLHDIELKMDMITNSLGKVQKFLVDDPETTLMHARKSAEAICYELYRVQKGEYPEYKTLQDYINIFRQWRSYPRKVISSLISIQQYCNEAVHANDSINSDTVKPVLASLSILVTWYFEEYLDSNVPKTISFLSQNKIVAVPEAPALDQFHILKNVFASKTLRVGIISFPPIVNYKMNDKKVEPEGISTKFLKKIAEANNLEIEFIAIQHEDAFSLLQSNKIDLLANFVNTPERAKLYDFAGMLFTLAVGGVVRQDDDRIKTTRDLKEKPVKIALCKGAIGTDMIKSKFKIRKETGRIIELETSDVADIITLVQAGIADIAITDNLTIQYYLKQNESHKLKPVFTNFPLYISEIGYMIQKDQPEFQNWLNEQINAIKDDPEIKQMEDDLYELYENAVQPY